MPRARGEKDYLNLTMGLNTEANPLAFPDNYTSDEKNFLLDKNGDVRVRRKGLLNSNADQAATSSGALLSLSDSFYWKSADIVILVFQTLSDEVFIRFHNNDSTFSFIGEYEVSGSAGFFYRPSFSQVLEGVVVSGTSEDSYTKPIWIVLNEDQDIEIYSVQVYFRDFELVNDNLTITERPDTLSEEHLYNLYNAGWYASRRNSSGDFVDPLTLFEAEESSLIKDAVFTTNNMINVSGGIGTVYNFSVGTNFTVTGSVSNDGQYEVAAINYLTLFDADITTVENTIVNEPSVSVTLNIVGGGYPSNADIPVLGTKFNSSGERVFSSETLFENVTGSSEAPRGHYIYDVEESVTRQDTLENKFVDGAVASTITLEDTIPT